MGDGGKGTAATESGTNVGPATAGDAGETELGTGDEPTASQLPRRRAEERGLSCTSRLGDALFTSSLGDAELLLLPPSAGCVAAAVLSALAARSTPLHLAQLTLPRACRAVRASRMALFAMRASRRAQQSR